MPNKCCAYECNSNYASTTERCIRSIFKFPRDDDLRAKWKDLKATQYSYINVCAKQLAADSINRYHIVKV